MEKVDTHSLTPIISVHLCGAVTGAAVFLSVQECGQFSREDLFRVATGVLLVPGPSCPDPPLSLFAVCV